MFKEELLTNGQLVVECTTDEEKKAYTAWAEENGCSIDLSPYSFFNGFRVRNKGLVSSTVESYKTHGYTVISYKEALLDPNPMPKLEGGMVIEAGFTGDSLVLLAVTDKYALNSSGHVYRISDLCNIAAIYRWDGEHLQNFNGEGDLVWQRLNPRQEKIDKIKETIAELQEQVEGLENE